MKRLVISMSLLTFFLFSCTHYYYAPNAQNVPIFREVNDFRLSASLGFGDEARYIDVQSAYSATNHIGVMLNFMNASGGNNNNSGNSGNGYYYEGALGYYNQLKNKGSLEVYGGIAFSNQHHQYDGYSTTADLSFTKIFIQPSIGYSTNGFDIAFSTRISRVSFISIDSYPGNNNSYSIPAINDIANNKSSLLLEPAVTARAGWKNFKIQAQLGWSENITNPNLKFEKTNLSLGFYITIADGNKTPPIKAVTK